ncbi:uncharacterized protein EI90DRAFT_3134521 [Cantharellus anzutake]|uniref:uncharacterized protein n=1 Tax=Cantharellus anzutake TaxID=1750568 RepID=UPI001906DC9C|nr:uncharacterized protein EI90DRAFT_3134521 [Cantharellus anzutake]KAF8316244.1 hypothetical protein EI90DRAFT_3134521 [Cantharellus anzutake]
MTVWKIKISFQSQLEIKISCKFGSSTTSLEVASSSTSWLAPQLIIPPTLSILPPPPASLNKPSIFITVPFYQHHLPFKGASSDSPPNSPGSPSPFDTSSPASTSPAMPDSPSSPSHSDTSSPTSTPPAMPNSPGSPSHSDTSSPTLTSPATPSNSKDPAPHVVVSSHLHGIPETMAASGVVCCMNIDMNEEMKSHLSLKRV